MESLKSLEWELGGQWTDLWRGGGGQVPTMSLPSVLDYLGHL